MSFLALFRFLDLPREIRNKIYRILLCSFAPRSTTVKPSLTSDFLDSLAAAEHDIDTSILLASRQIHREAYDTMVKTNRFVRLISLGGVPLKSLLNHLRVPVVAKDSVSTSFKGYVLSVSLTAPNFISMVLKQGHHNIEPFSLMVLSRDLDILCDVLMDGDVYVPGFGMEISVKITVAPQATLESSLYKDPLSPFFSEVTQQALLQPFRSRLRGFKKTKVGGLVDEKIAKAAEEDIAQDSATDPEAVISNYQAQKEEGQAFYKAKRPMEACLKWLDAALEIEQLVTNSSWQPLVEKGGRSFVKRLAEIHFLMKLNILHVQIGDVQKNQPYAKLLATDTVTSVMTSLTNEYWMPGYQWAPSAAQQAKFCYRQALLLRVMDDRGSMERAVTSIEHAHRLLPNDVVVARERIAVLAWSNSVRG